MTIDSFFSKAQQFQYLTPERELELFSRLDNSAIELLTNAYLRLVISIARKHSFNQEDYEDLIQVGTIGLIQAISSFDVSKGGAFSTFAATYIRGEILAYIVNNHRSVKIVTTNAHKKLFFNLRKYRRNGAFTKDQVKQISEELCVDPDDVLEMERRLFVMDESIDVEVSDYASETHDMDSIIDLLDEEKRISKLSLAISSLDERSKEILKKRYLSEEAVPLRELSEKFGVSIERVRQLEQRAINHVRELVA